MKYNQQEILEKLTNIDNYEFEHFVAELWELRGWKTTVTQASNDGGIDIIAEKESPFQQKQIIQAKKYSRGNNVGSPEIQQYSSLLRQVENADTVVVVTTSDFTTQARGTANNLNVKLVDGAGLYDIIKNIECTNLVDKYIGFSGEEIHRSTRLTSNPVFSDEFIEKYEKMVQLETEGHNPFLNVVFNHNNSVDSHLQVLAGNQYNLTRLRDEEVRLAKNFGEEYNLPVVSEGDTKVGYYVTLGNGDDIELSSDRVAGISGHILSEVYQFGQNDIVELELIED